MSLKRDLQEAERDGRAYARTHDRNGRLWTLDRSPYWGVVFDWAFTDEQARMKREHDLVHKLSAPPVPPFPKPEGAP